MSRFTCKTISNKLLEIFPQFAKIELVRGNGYFYFGDIELKGGKPFYTQVNSIYVCNLNHMSFEKWVEFASFEIRDALERAS